MFNWDKIYKPKEVVKQSGELLKLDSWGETVAAENRPERNEDAILIEKEKGLFGILDGMGGHAAGSRASQEAKDYISENLRKLPDNLTLPLIQKELEKVFFGANTRLLSLAKEDPNLKEMGTTASIVKIWESAQGDKKAIIANIGDSRVYIFRANKQLEQITLDDNIVSQISENEQEARVIQQRLNNVTDLNTLSSQERMLFNRRNKISQALGINEIKPRIYTIEVYEGDKIAITSDGVHDNLTDEEIAQILHVTPDNRTTVENLIKASRDRNREEHPRAKADDMSAIVVDIPFKEQVLSKKIIDFPEGKIVNVRRSNGEIESDWQVFGFNPKTNCVIVRKFDTEGRIIQKKIPQEELRDLNNPENKN